MQLKKLEENIYKFQNYQMKDRRKYETKSFSKRCC